jgi:predicted DNA-binding transcriptional regulator AlpA
MTKGSVSATADRLAPMSPDLAGLAEIAEMLRITKRTAWNYTKRADFPEPLDRLASGPVWRRADVEAWGKANLPLPPGRPRKSQG